MHLLQSILTANFTCKEQSVKTIIALSKEARKPAQQFSQGFEQWLKDNPNENKDFTRAWLAGDNKTLKLLTADYIDGLEAEAVRPNV